MAIATLWPLIVAPYHPPGRAGGGLPRQVSKSLSHEVWPTAGRDVAKSRIALGSARPAAASKSSGRVMEGFSLSQGQNDPFSPPPAVRSGAGPPVPQRKDPGVSFMHRPYRPRPPPNQTAAPASLAFSNMTASISQACTNLVPKLLICRVRLCVRAVAWCCRCIVLFLAADRKHGALVAARQTGARYARARANFRGCLNHVPMWSGGWRGGLQWKQESKPWKLWSALKALGLVTGIRGSEQGAGAKVPSSRTTVGHPRGGEGRAAAGNSVAGEAETTGRPLGAVSWLVGGR